MLKERTNSHTFVLSVLFDFLLIIKTAIEEIQITVLIIHLQDNLLDIFFFCDILSMELVNFSKKCMKRAPGRF